MPNRPRPSTVPLALLVGAAVAAVVVLGLAAWLSVGSADPDRAAAASWLEGQRQGTHYGPAVIERLERRPAAAGGLVVDVWYWQRTNWPGEGIVDDRGRRVVNGFASLRIQNGRVVESSPVALEGR